MRGERISDGRLAVQARHGSQESFAILKSRHRVAATEFARTIVKGTDPAELVETAYAVLWGSIGSSSRHSWVFRRQLFQTIRALAISQNDAVTSGHKPHRTVPMGRRLQDSTPSARTAETMSAVRAFRRLPLPWQEVLWYLDVERISTTDAATYLGIARSTARALRAVALDGLKQEWIEIYSPSLQAPACRKTVQAMGTDEFEMESSTTRREAVAHINGCLRCMIVHAEIDNLMAVIRPVLRRPLFTPVSTSAS